jgi:uncharacterized protein (DUF952 family)/GNAT superfamily N-acetyltransferase
MAATGGSLLHLTSPATWRVALSAGSVVTPSVVTDGFIHLSSPEQVHLPANRLFAGREDLLLLVLDPARLVDEVRWEPGVPTDPESMRFPHVYGPLPVTAVTSVVPYRPGADGSFTAPGVLPAPGDLVARAMAFDPSLAHRRAAAVVPVTGGFAAVDPRVRHSWEHNSLWLTGDVDAATLVGDAETIYGGRSRARAVLDRPPPAELEDLGWEVHEERVMVLGPDVPAPDPGPAPVVPVTSEVMAGLWGPTWRREIPGIDDDALDDLVRREPFIDAHLRLVDLAVLGDDGAPVAAAQLRVDGATAAVEAVMTDPDAQGKGLGTSVVLDAVRRARQAGCDLVHLIALTDDWPRHWYARLGFVDVGPRWVALAPRAPS